MAFTRGQTDRFGRPIPASPGYQVLINADGSEVQQRNRLVLPVGLVASDSDDNDASSLALLVTPADMSLAANSVLGNATGVTAAPTALSATATGLGVLAAATQAALTALIALATTSLAGLMSAPDKVKLNGQGTRIHSAAFTAQTTVASTTWVAGTYRRIEVNVKELGGLSTSIFIACVGLTAGSYYTYGNLMDALTAANATAANGFKANTPEGLASLNMNIQIATDGGVRSATGIANMATGKGVVFSGTSVDNTHDVTGIVATFSTNSSGWLEVIGYE